MNIRRNWVAVREEVDEFVIIIHYMHAIASQWLTDHSKYVLPSFQNKCLNFMLHTKQNEWIYTLKYVYMHQCLEYVLVVHIEIY